MIDEFLVAVKTLDEYHRVSNATGQIRRYKDPVHKAKKNKADRDRQAMYKTAKPFELSPERKEELRKKAKGAEDA